MSRYALEPSERIRAEAEGAGRRLHLLRRLEYRQVAGKARLAYRNIQLKINQDRCVSTAVLNFFADY